MKHLIPIEEVEKVATSEDYFRLDYKEDQGMVSYSDGATRINIYLTTMTVATCLNHPKKGKTQLFRKGVNLKMLREIFEYPRKHTGKGYIKKKK